MEQKKKLGFLGGTFNPIHVGHLHLAENARTQFKLDRVLFIPNCLPPHRNAPERDLLEPEKRYSLTVLGTLTHPQFFASNIEIRRGGISYTVDTVVELKARYPNHGLYLICGADTLIHHAWHRFRELVRLLDGFLLASRNTLGAEEAIQHLKKEAPEFSSKLKKIKMNPVKTSATGIRERIREGKSIRRLTPLSVAVAIEKYQMYRGVSLS